MDEQLSSKCLGQQNKMRLINISEYTFISEIMRTYSTVNSAHVILCLIFA